MCADREEERIVQEKMKFQNRLQAEHDLQCSLSSIKSYFENVSN
jgi:hypothetical protein